MQMWDYSLDSAACRTGRSMSFLFTISSIFRMTNVQVELMQRALHVDRLVCEPDKSGSDSSVSRKRGSVSSVSGKK